MIARVDNLTGTGDAEAGIMIRKNTTTNAANYGIFVSADGTIKATYRNSTWTSQDYAASGSAPKWLKLEKVGTTVTAFTSNNGTTWTNVASENMNATLSDTFTAGLAVASGNINNNASANFSNITWPDQGTQSAIISNDINAKSNQNGFALNQNYPNPFNNVTSISYQMEEAGDVEFKIFDISGRVVWSMDKQNQSSGKHTFEWNVENQHNQEVAGGIYFYQIKITTTTSRFIEYRKMVISKLRSAEY
jgi:flagellar hook assembly protein FlgD